MPEPHQPVPLYRLLALSTLASIAIALHSPALGLVVPFALVVWAHRPRQPALTSLLLAAMEGLASCGAFLSLGVHVPHGPAALVRASVLTLASVGAASVRRIRLAVRA